MKASGLIMMSLIEVPEHDRCSASHLCRPFAAAAERHWISAIQALPVGPGGANRRVAAVGDRHSQQFQGILFCPFCGVDLREAYQDYMEPATTTTLHRLRYEGDKVVRDQPL